MIHSPGSGVLYISSSIYSGVWQHGCGQEDAGYGQSWMRTTINSKATYGIMRGLTVYSLTQLRLWECVICSPLHFDGGMDWPPFGLVDETMILQVVLQVVS